jgi:hypothetical protein
VGSIAATTARFELVPGDAQLLHFLKQSGRVRPIALSKPDNVDWLESVAVSYVGSGVRIARVFLTGRATYSVSNCSTRSCRDTFQKQSVRGVLLLRKRNQT